MVDLCVFFADKAATSRERDLIKKSLKAKILDETYLVE